MELCSELQGLFLSLILQNWDYVFLFFCFFRGLNLCFHTCGANNIQPELSIHVTF